MVFILYKLYVLLPYTYPTPKLSPHRRRCIYFPPQKNTLCMIYKRFKLWGHWKCPHKPHKHAHTHTHTHTPHTPHSHTTHSHTLTHAHTLTHTHTHSHTHALMHTHTHTSRTMHTHTHTHTHSRTHTHVICKFILSVKCFKYIFYLKQIL